jgi:drug/metabolite transporter (DMT)-like permease
VLGSLAVVASAACYATGALYAARRLGDVPPTLVSLGAMGSAGLFLFLPGLLDWAHAGIGWSALAAVLVLGLGNGTLAVLLYFALIAGAGATPTMLSAYLVPVTALILGVVLLDEALTAAAVVGMALILGGVALGTGTVRRRAPAEVGGAAVTPPA